MSVSASRIITITYSGDVSGTETLSAAVNAASPGSVEIKTLALGDNTITVPTGGSTCTACTIIPPITNIISITLKGIAGDTGIRLHNTDPSTISRDPATTSFVLTTGAEIIGVRFYWS